MSPNWIKSLLSLAIPLALIVAVAGAYTRLTHAGLGCPDWPGCYGHWRVAEDPLLRQELQERFPEQPLELSKAHTEMGHRYLAGTLGLIIMTLGMVAWRKPNHDRKERWLASALITIILLQASLGRWTVTLRLSPVIVMAHLCMGFLTLALLSVWWLRLSTVTTLGNVRLPAIFTLGSCILQIILGGWTSANYAALVCGDFPYCGSPIPFAWVPKEAFLNSWSLSPGLFPHSIESLIFIHMAHRVGAVITTLAVIWLSLCLWRQQAQLNALILLSLLGIQVSLGIANVLASLPLGIAVAHHLVAALILLTLTQITYASRV